VARLSHSVYVVELSKEVVYEPRFRKANPGYDPTKPCVYVGMTGLTPEKRLAKHKAGVKANRFVQKYGLRLLPKLYAYANPMPYDAARDMEVELAIALREKGYGVWQA
jgi:predicted GIY-YIG superfamily endonuclease